MVHINLFPTSAPSLTLLAIWAVSNAAAFGMNISLQIIREDYHPVNIVFQVAICHPCFFFFDSPDHCCFQIVLQGSYLICFFYLIR